MTWRFRDGTLDQTIFNIVVLFNEYRLPPRFAPGDIVIDIGAHMGSFPCRVVERLRDSLLHRSRPDELRDRGGKFATRYRKRSRAAWGAAWRSDRNTDELRFDGYHLFSESYPGLKGILHTGHGSVVWGSGEPVAKSAFDEIVDLVTNHGERPVRLLKLDCEGAEWPILLTSQRLDLMTEICGEFHEIGGQFLEVGADRPGKKPVFSLQTSRTSPSMCWSTPSAMPGSPSPGAGTEGRPVRLRGSGYSSRRVRRPGMNRPKTLDGTGSGAT